MKKFFGILAVGCCVVLTWQGVRIFNEISKAVSEDPTVWESDMEAFVAESERGDLPENPIVLVGSSSFRLWKNMQQDLAPLPVVNRGFGGARLADIEYWAKELVSINSPSAVVVFCGTNDIRPDVYAKPQILLETYQSFVKRVRASNSELPIYFVGITPSPSRWSVWNVAQQTNELISQWSMSERGMYFIDTGPALLTENGEPDPDNYVFDGLHLSDNGYQIWTSIIKPRLLEDFPPS
ncbi:MAG: GDSL-type esterase/lipase family protein [Pseudomonadales bacterium]